MRTPSGFGLIHATSLAYERDLNPEVKRNEVTMVSKYNAERKYLKKLPKALAYQKQLCNDI